MDIKCIITDDEPIARKGLKEYVDKIDYLTLVGECEDAFQLNTLLKSVQPDLLFLDIEMPDLTGIEFLSTLQHPPKVIFTTAYEQYALKGYELNVVDYLLKPISFERFLQAVNKVYDRMEKESSTAAATDDYVFVKTDKQIRKVVLQDILWVESMENYVIIYTTMGKEIIYTTLKNMLSQLPEKQFLQVHRSFIINIQKVQAIEGNLLHIGSYKIPVARNQRERVFSLVLSNKLI